MTPNSGFLLTQQSIDINRSPHIQLWIITDNGAVKLNISDQQPLFFIKNDDLAFSRQLLQQQEVFVSIKTLALTDFSSNPISACYFNNIKDSRAAKAIIHQAGIISFESDFRLDQRYLMERLICGGIEFKGHIGQRSGYLECNQAKVRPCDYVPQLKTLSLDIECSQHGELYSIGFHHPDYEKVIMIGDTEPAPDYIQWVDNEAQLLEQLEFVINQFDPDIIIGWNVINFDFRLLIKRAQYHGKKLRLGRGQSFAYWRDSANDNNGYITIPGRVVIDGIDALKTATYHFASFSLDFVGQSILNRGKISDDVHNRMAEINHNFAHNKPALAAYNLEDCRLVTDIFAKTQLLEFLIFRTKLTGLPLDRVGGSVAAFTNLYLPKLHRAGYIAPNLPPDGGLASPGGYVMTSKPGLYDNVLVLDFKSLYPSIIRTFKIDPMGLIEGLNAPENAISGFKGALFSRDKHFLPQIITDLWQQRDQAKKQNDQPRSQAIKIIMNSFYGVLGSGGCRFYDTRLASSITMRGHEIIQQTAQWIEEKHQVIYGDTDSVFVLIGQQYNSQQAQQIGQELARDINQRWHQLIQQQHQLPCELELEFETLYSRFLMPTIRGSELGSKKRYAGILEQQNGQKKLIFKGLESVRSDWTVLAQNFQQQLYQLIFDDKDPIALILETVEKTESGELDQQLVYTKRLRRKLSDYVKNIPPQVKAARIADQKNAQLGRSLQYQNRGIIHYVMTMNGPEPIEYITSPIDYQHYIDKQLLPVADGILPFINLSFAQITDAQMGLF
ncbi:MAG: DNA polymerase II [Gammaproteobacteria bacterium]|nr:DNA polymerase II [Gammaproteobacteria bacterium]